MKRERINDLLATVKTALEKWDNPKYAEYLIKMDPDGMMGWLRALVARCEQAEVALVSANEMCMSAYGSTASEVLAENTRLAAEHTQVHKVNSGLLRDLAAARARFADMEGKRNALFDEAASARAEVSRLRDTERKFACSACGWHHAVDCAHKADLAALRERVSKAETAAHQSAIHPCAFCGTGHSATRWVQEGKVGWLECYWRERHDAAVEAAFREGYGVGLPAQPAECENNAWLASEAKARLT